MKSESSKQNFKKYLLLVFSFTFLFLAGSSASALTCDVKNACGAGETAVLKMSDLDNAHAGFVAASGYANNICCSESAVVAVGINCGGNFDTFLKLSAVDNAHVGKVGFSAYAFDACISVNIGSVACGYSNANCPAGYECLAEISGDDNAHIGDCNSGYMTKVCCGFSCITSCPGGCADIGQPDIGCGGFCPDNTGNLCDDSNLCTLNDVCGGGICIGTPEICGNGACLAGCETPAACPADCFCGNGTKDSGEVCDKNGDVGCAAPIPACNTDCSGCIGCALKSNFSFLGKPVICIVQDATKWILSVIGSIVLLILILSGIYYMSSGDNPKRQENAKKMITYAIIGIILIFVSYALLALIDKIFVQP